MSEWPYPYCPHQAFNSNLQIRLASIPYSFVPDPTIDAFTNVNIKCANLEKHNIPSLAYEQYFCSAPDVDTNFAKDYYLQTKDVAAIKFDNNIVEEKKEELEKGNAYVIFVLYRLWLQLPLSNTKNSNRIEKMLLTMLGEGQDLS